MPTLLLAALLALLACASPVTSTTDGAPLLDCPPVTLHGDPAAPASVVLDNGIARVRYPGGNATGGELAMHRLEVLAPDGWRAANEARYGDWSFFAAPILAPAARVNVLLETEDAVEVAFVFDHTLDSPGGYGGCYLPGCGVVYRDVHGAAIYDTSRPNAPRIRHVTLHKVIGMRRCEPGYRVGYHSVPPLAWGSWIERRPNESSLGERELGLGWIAGVTWSSAGDIVRNPDAGRHTELGILRQAEGPWWFATVPARMGVPIRVVPFMSLDHPLESWVWQFSPGQQGVPLVHFVNAEFGPDGRPELFQAFIGAVVYESSDLAAEPTPEVRELVLDALPDWH